MVGKRLARVVLSSATMGVLLLSTAGHASAASIIFVNSSAIGSNNGTSWGNAYKSLQTALAHAVGGQQIWVAKGTYKPGTGRTAAFTLKSGVAIYGGFAGTETLLSQRSPKVNITILSGAIGTTASTDNVYHVVKSSGLDGTALLDGFTITAGYADGSGTNGRGGGMYNLNSSPSLANLIFSSNHAGSGGGMYNEGSNPTMKNVSFKSNSAAFGGGVFNTGSSPRLQLAVFTANSAQGGGAIYNEAGSKSILSLTTFSSNTSSGRGGAIYNDASDSVLTDVSFTGNSAAWGGGMYISHSAPLITDAAFAGNSASQQGGGIVDDLSSNSKLTNVTFSGNTAGFEGGGLLINQSSPVMTNVTFKGNYGPSGGSAIYDENSSKPSIQDAIFWLNVGLPITNATSSVSVLVDSIVSSGCPGSSLCIHVLTADPKLGPFQGNGGYTKTMALGADSAAIDTGGVHTTCASTDQRSVPRPQGGKCDMGAYEVRATVYASAALSDGWIAESTENSGVGGSHNSTDTTLRIGDGAENRQFVGILSFNTASLPDAATLVRARLVVKQESVAGNDPFGSLGSLLIDVTNPFFGAAVGLENADFQSAALAPSGGQIGPTLVSNFYTGFLNSAGLGLVNKLATTQLRLHFSLDDDNDHIGDYLSLYSGNSVFSNRPKLIVYYNP